MIVITVMWTKLRPVAAEKQCGRNKGGKIEQKKKCEIKDRGEKSDRPKRQRKKDWEEEEKAGSEVIF